MIPEERLQAAIKRGVGEPHFVMHDSGQKFPAYPLDAEKDAVDFAKELLTLYDYLFGIKPEGIPVVLGLIGKLQKDFVTFTLTQCGDGMWAAGHEYAAGTAHGMVGDFYVEALRVLGIQLSKWANDPLPELPPRKPAEFNP